MPRGELLKCAQEAAAALGLDPAAVPPYTTLNTWAHRYRAFKLAGLLDSVRSDAGRQRTVLPEVARRIEVLRFGGRLKPASILRALVRALPEAIVPRYHSVRRVVRAFERKNPHLMVLADEGIAGYRALYRLALVGDRHPGGAVFGIDSTVVDLWIRIPDPQNPGEWIAVRLVLTVIEDLGSRLLVAFNLSFKAVDSGVLLGTFRRAVIQEANYPGLLSPGMPREVVLDKGAEHQGQFRDMLDQHGVRIRPMGPNSPESNGRTERIIQTIQSEVFAHLPGYSKTHKRFDPYAPAEHDAKRRFASLKYEPYRIELPVMALWTVEQLEHAVLAWAHAYNNVPHVGLPACTEDMQRLAQLAEQYDRDMEIRYAA
jgi:transposase InsO family protein